MVGLRLHKQGLARHVMLGFVFDLKRHVMLCLAATHMRRDERFEEVRVFSKVLPKHKPFHCFTLRFH